MSENIEQQSEETRQQQQLDILPRTMVYEKGFNRTHPLYSFVKNRQDFGTDCYYTSIKCINEARESLDIAMFRLTEHSYFECISRAAARLGAKMRILLDEDEDNRPLVSRAKALVDEYGIGFKYGKKKLYYPMTRRMPVNPKYKQRAIAAPKSNGHRCIGFDSSMHLKMVIVDGKLVISGCHNFSGVGKLGGMEELSGKHHYEQVRKCQEHFNKYYAQGVDAK